MAEDVSVWLRREVQEHLHDFGPMGLYEIIWTLNGSQFDLPVGEKRLLARKMAEEVLKEKVAELYILGWPSHEIQSDPLPHKAIYDDASWREGDRFVALVPIDPVAPPA